MFNHSAFTLSSARVRNFSPTVATATLFTISPYLNTFTHPRRAAIVIQHTTSITEQLLLTQHERLLSTVQLVIGKLSMEDYHKQMFTEFYKEDNNYSCSGEKEDDEIHEVFENLLYF